MKSLVTAVRALFCILYSIMFLTTGFYYDISKRKNQEVNVGQKINNCHEYKEEIPFQEYLHRLQMGAGLD